MSSSPQKLVKDIDLIISLEDQSVQKGNLYLGSVYGADRLKVCNRENIFSVLSVGGEPESQVRFDQKYNHQTLNAFDHPRFNMFPFFDQAVSYLVEQLQTSNVLVHCFAGASRSSTIVIAYLMREHNMTLDQALAYAKSKRAIVSPNTGFLQQLKQYEQKLQSESQ